MRSIAVAVVLTLVVNVVSGLSCRCVPGNDHPQDKLCTSDYVVRGIVQSGPENQILEIPREGTPSKPWKRHVLVYRVQVIRIFKGEKKVLDSTPLRGYQGKPPVPLEVAIFTDNNACAAKLLPGEEYVLGGYVDGQDLEIFSCNWIQLWGDLSHSQRIGIKRNYARNCPCRTSLCSWMDPLGGLMDYYCGTKHLYCAMRDDHATCKWKDIGSAYGDCVNDATLLGFYRK